MILINICTLTVIIYHIRLFIKILTLKYRNYTNIINDYNVSRETNSNKS